MHPYEMSLIHENDLDRQIEFCKDNRIVQIITPTLNILLFRMKLDFNLMGS